VDLTVGKVYELNGEGALDFDNSRRVLCAYSEIPIEDGRWFLEPGVYHCAMNEWISIPKDLYGLLLPRSSALACGIHIHSALWDPGYQGRSFIHTAVSRRATIFANARIAQMIFGPVLGEASSYSGAFLGEDVLRMGKRGTQEKLEG
jgi:dUTP pyrophosphatase